MFLQKKPAGILTASGGEKSPENVCFRGGTANKLNSLLTFFYPDYTVDPGVSPSHAPMVRVGFDHRSGIGTAFLTLPRRLYYLPVKNKYILTIKACQIDCEIRPNKK